MEERVRNVRSYKKTPVIAVPEIPQYFQHQENNTSIEMLELASLAFLADSTSLVHELALTWHIRFAREITR